MTGAPRIGGAEGPRRGAPLRVLHLEDSDDDSALILRELRRGGFDPAYECVETQDAFRAALRAKEWDVIISDFALPHYNGLAALAEVQQQGKDIPFILVSGTIGEETAVEAMLAGASDYVLKDRLGRLALAVHRVVRESKGRAASRSAEEALHHSEEQLRQAQRMEAVGRLAGGIAHDFNNVLSVILSYGDMLLADLRPGDPMRDDVNEIRLAAQRAADLTRQLLMFSRQQVLAPKVLDLNDVVASMDKMLQRVLGADVRVVSLPMGSLAGVRADRSSVEQVIMNLVVNARDAMPTGGTLTMQTANVTLDAAYAQSNLGVTPGPHVMLSVTDTGTGIEKATLLRMFEPFFTTKGIGKGTGLGLSTIFGIVQQSGGSISVDSKMGRGTTFKIYLPRVEGTAEAARVVESLATARGSETILLVEDDDQVRIVARGLLKKCGYYVIDACNAAEALRHAAEYAGTIHLLLSDVVMPQMSGPALAKQIASVRPDIKVLCMSGYTDDSIARHGVLEAHFEFLQKPFTPVTLASKVRDVLDGAVSRRSPPPAAPPGSGGP